MDGLHTMTFARAVAALLATVCTGCSGGSAGGPAAQMSATPITVSPSSIAIGVPSQPASVDVSNATQSIAARADNPLLAALSVSGSKVSIVPIASGQATIAISSGGSSAAVPLTIGLCTPPNPTFVLASPSNGATGVSSSTGSILLATQNLNGYTAATVTSTIVARVVSSAGTEVVTAAPLHVASPPPNSPLSGPFFSFSIPALPAASTFAVQAYIASEPCLPASAIGVGSFST
jgi:hypothetical protein